MDTTHKTTGPVRSRTIYINHENDWMLRALAKAPSDTPGMTKDHLADAILTGYFHHNHPELAALYKQRQEIDNLAIRTAAEKKQKV